MAQPACERREELQWFASESGPYAGEWVALDGKRLVAHGDKLADVRAAANLAGGADPLFACVRGDSTLPFGGW